MPERDQEEQDRRIELMEAQLSKITFDMAAWRVEQMTRERALRRSTWTISLSAIGIVVAAFAAGATWWNYLHLTH